MSSEQLCHRTQTIAFEPHGPYKSPASSALAQVAAVAADAPSPRMLRRRVGAIALTPSQSGDRQCGMIDDDDRKSR
ncbi:uncharacterized protein A4U43_UnF9660 [Asparagus officinalis]|uniref:Uncharacterized protein n=1 Tax=Asparagus officinalis TaxID=4686 RepID=A0A1R3L5P2_ASPOF|nr:uncharacterized protein A4U43_UnF9660 [Asparagus officinalis]